MRRSTRRRSGPIFEQGPRELERRNALFDEAEQLDQKAIDEVVTTADVVCSTNSTAGSDLLGGHTLTDLGVTTDALPTDTVAKGNVFDQFIQHAGTEGRIAWF